MARTLSFLNPPRPGASGGKTTGGTFGGSRPRISDDYSDASGKARDSKYDSHVLVRTPEHRREKRQRDFAHLGGLQPVHYAGAVTSSLLPFNLLCGLSQARMRGRFTESVLGEPASGRRALAPVDGGAGEVSQGTHT